MLASVVITVKGAIAMGMGWVAGAFWIGGWRRMTGRGCSVGIKWKVRRARVRRRIRNGYAENGKRRLWQMEIATGQRGR